MKLRESRLAEVEQALQAFQWHRGLDTDAIGALSALAGLRDASLEVVQAVVVSDRHQASDSIAFVVYAPACHRGMPVGSIAPHSIEQQYLKTPHIEGTSH